MLRQSVLSFSLFSILHTATANLGLHGADDLFSYFTRPDLRPPKWDITIHDREQIAPGYWFVNPYAFRHNFLGEDIKWGPCEAGPMIYDSDGELIWSGACIYGNHAVFEFNLVEYDDEEGQALVGAVQPFGHGFFLGSDYEMKHEVKINDNARFTNLHEFNVFDKGRRVLHTMRGPHEISTKDMGRKGTTWIEKNGFRELDVKTEKILFEWWVHEHVSLNESTFTPKFGNRPGLGGFNNEAGGKTWDVFHINAVDKTPQGNYLLSSRHTDSIFHINGKNKEIIWRLGGTRSDFELEDGLAFSRQHHIRCVESSKDRMVVSFHNNNGADPALDPQKPTGPASNGLLLELNFKKDTKWTAKILRQYDRPDGKVSVKRGSMQRLPNGNVFMDWTMQGYMSEHTEDGKVLMEAKFFKQRLGTYRAYKHTGWVGKPKDKPIVRAFGYPSRDEASTTACYVSWNGATEVKTWEFYSHGEFIGSTNRTGFESLYVAPKLLDKVQVKAVDKDGNKLGESKIEAVEMAAGWDPDSPRIASLIHDSKDTVNSVSFYILVVLVIGLIFRGCLKGFYAKRMGKGSGGKLKFPWMSGYDSVPSEEATELRR